MKSGFIAIVGRPNAGKSTLLNSIMNQKLAIISSKPQTTRNNIQGILSDEDSQMIFIDTPGIHKPHHELGRTLNKSAYASLQDVDVIYYMVDGSFWTWRRICIKSDQRKIGKYFSYLK